MINIFFNVFFLLFEDSSKPLKRTDINHGYFIHELIPLHLLIFLNLTKIFFTKKVHKTPNPMQLRFIGVINRVLIFRHLKKRQGWIFSYSFPSEKINTTFTINLTDTHYVNRQIQSHQQQPGPQV